MKQIIIAVVIALLVGGTAPWWWDKVFPSPQPGPTPIRVLGTEHRVHPDGRYFNFDASELDALLKSTDWDDQILFISKQRDGNYRKAVVWRRSNGGSGTAHGRYLPEGKAGDWRAGDSIFVEPRLRGPARIAPTKT